MTTTLTQLASRIEEKSAEFDLLPLRPFTEASREKGKPGIYVLMEGGQPVYVGTTRNLAQRFRAHITPNHNSASFALKRTRQIHGLQATYKKQGGRAQIASDPETSKTFRTEIDKIRRMDFRFMEVSDPIERYLLELAVTLRYALPLDGFDRH